MCVCVCVRSLKDVTHDLNIAKTTALAKFQGCTHDRGNKDACDLSEYPQTNYGYRDPAGDFYTVMAYRCVSTQCDNIPSGPCKQVPYFSGAASYNGKSLGGANHVCTFVVMLLPSCAVTNHISL